MKGASTTVSASILQKTATEHVSVPACLCAMVLDSAAAPPPTNLRKARSVFPESARSCCAK